MAKKTKDKDQESAERIEHVQATRPEPWPGIPGRSEEHEAEPSREAGSEGDSEASSRRSSDSTEAQRQLERDMHEPTRR